MTTLGQIVAAGAVVALFALPSPTETLAPNFFTAGGKDLPSVGRRSSESTSPLKSFERGPNSLEYPNDALMQADSSGMISAGIRKALDEKALRAFERLHASSVSASQQQACFTSHEAAEVLKLLQAATRK